MRRKRDAFASLVAVEDATGFGRNGREAVGGLEKAAIEGGLLTRKRDIGVPAEIVDALTALDGKGQALRVRLITTVSI